MHWWSRIGFPLIYLNTAGNRVQWRLPFFFDEYPKNLIFLPLLLVLNHVTAIFEVTFAISINSLGIFSHGSHTIFNGITLTGLVTSLLINWRATRRYNLTYVATVAKLNFLVGLGLLINSIVLGYLSLRDIEHPTVIASGKLCYLVPVPELILNIIGSYLVLHGDEDPAIRGKWGKGASLEGEFARKRKMSSRSVYWHMLANAVGSISAIGATILVQCFGWITADALCAAFISMIMLCCSMHMLKESISMVVTLRTQPNVFVVSYHVNDEMNCSSD